MKSIQKFNRGISLISWAYNEETVIETFVRRAWKMMEEVSSDFEILIVDDGSNDRTPDILNWLSKEFKELRVITHASNENVGISCRDAIRGASKEFVFWQTTDWSYDLTNLRLFLELLGKYDVVAGVRRAPVSKMNSKIPKTLLLFLQIFGINHITRRSDTISKAFVSISNYFLIRTLLQFSMSDFQNVVFYRTNLVQSINPEARSSFINPEFLYRTYMKGAKIVEVPISFLPRQCGEAKGTKLKSILRSIKDILKFWIKWKVFCEIPTNNIGIIRRLDSALWKQVDAAEDLDEKLHLITSLNNDESIPFSLKLEGKYS